MRLHVGSGDKTWPGFVNCDLHAEADVNTDCKRLPFEANSVDEIHAIHFVEHVPRLELENMLIDWHRVVKPGGKVVIEVPSLDKMAKLIVDGEKNIRLTLLGIFGDPRDPKPGMMHQWAYTKGELTNSLMQCGFDKVEVMEPVFHLMARDMRLKAV